MSALGDKVADARAVAEGATPAVRNTLADDLDRNLGRIEQALPSGMDPQRFRRTVLLEAMRTPRLAECHAATVLGAVLNAAQLGLEPGPLGHVYLIPRWSGREKHYEATLLIGYKGYIDLALRGGRVEAMSAHVVREADFFEYEYGTGEQLRHRPAPTDRGEPVWAYAVAHLPRRTAFEVLSVEQIEARRGRGNDDSGSSPWRTDWDAMAAKTAIRALAPFLPQTPLFAHAVRLDESVRTDLEHDLDEIPDPVRAELDETSPTGEGTPEESAGDAGQEAPTPPADGSAEPADLSPAELIAKAKSLVSQVDLAELDAFCAAHEIPTARKSWNVGHAVQVIAWIEAG